MSFTLGIDASSVELGIGIIDENNNGASLSRYMRCSHSEHILESVKAVMASSGSTPAQITRVGVAVGPGSFTGLRVAIAFVKGFCFRTETLIFPISSLEATARAFIAANGSTITVAFDARNNEVFWGSFRVNAQSLERIDNDRHGTVEEFAKICGATDIIVTDTLGYAKSTAFSFLSNQTNVFPIEKTPMQRGLACARLAAAEPKQSTKWVTSFDLQPQYLCLSTPQRLRQKQLTGANP